MLQDKVKSAFLFIAILELTYYDICLRREAAYNSCHNKYRFLWKESVLPAVDSSAT
jgi:hypothetical protein